MYLLTINFSVSGPSCEPMPYAITTATAKTADTKDTLHLFNFSNQRLHILTFRLVITMIQLANVNF